MDTTHQLYPISRFYDSGEGNFYYPYGNTPAEDFLENVHPNLVKEPDILVLGCGDIRSCFYTLWKHFTANSHSNAVPSFSGVHFVLNDRSAAVLARNIIFLHLCMQKPSNIHGAEFNQWLCAMWAIWFSKNLHLNHEKVLNSALRELLHHSIDTKSWTSKENPLNSLVQFSSECTLSKIHDVWNMWLSHQFNKKSDQQEMVSISVSMSEKTDVENLFGMSVSSSLSSDEREKIESEISSCSSGNSFAEYVVCTGQVFPVMKFVANVTMYERTDDKYIMDSLLPFRCFHHTFQFSSNNLITSCTDSTVLDQLIVADERFQEYPLLANSVQQFALWLSSTSVFTCTSGASESIKFTFHCSDAVEFCNELQNCMYESKLKANRFDVVYTSNLLDPVCPPNVVLFSIPLLKADGYLFTTTMKYKLLAQTTHEYIAKSFGINNKMLPILFGIRCINHESDEYRDRVSIRPVPVETNAICPRFTPYYPKVLVWEKLPSMITQDIPPDLDLWHALYSSISSILSIPFVTENTATSQTAVKMLQVFLAHVNADDSDGTFWEPLCSLLKYSFNCKHLLHALQTHSFLSGLHLHLLVTDKTCPLCNKIPMSEYFGQIRVSVPSFTQFQAVNLYAQIYKSKEQKQEYSTFDCLAIASSNYSRSLKLSFIAPIHLCDSGHYVSIVSFCERRAPNILTEGPLKSFLSTKVTYSFSKSKIHRKPEVLSTSLGYLKSHYGNGDTFESIIALSKESYSAYSKSKKIHPERVSASKIIISCGVHKFELSYPHPINFSTLSVKISRSARMLTIVASRRSYKFHDEEAPLFLVYPDCKVTLPKLNINDIALGCLMGMQCTDFEATQLRSQTSRLPVTDLKNFINLMMQEKETYFTFVDPPETVYVMVMVINRVFDYQLKAPAIDLIYGITTEVPVMKKWMKFISSVSVMPIMPTTIEIMDKAFLYFSKRTISSSSIPSLLTVKKKVGGCFKRAVIYPLYGDPDDNVQSQKKSWSDIKSDPLRNKDVQKIESHSCSLCRRMAIDLFTCEKCLAVQFCGKCKKENLNKHKVLCKERKSEIVKPLNSVATSTSPQPANVCSYCSSQSCRLMKCSKCHSVQYCSQECQKKHWTEHKTHCHYTPNIEPKYDKAPLDSQTESKRELSTQVLNSCALCYQTSQTLKACSNCLAVKYCSKECQRNHWIVHKMVCKSQAKVSNGVSTCSYCSKVSSVLKKCTLCHAAQYCDKECQTKHWKVHKIRCKSEKVSSSCTLQMSTSKSAIAELEQETEMKCSFCSRQAKFLKKCMRCHSAMYCNRICQQKHWAIHKTLCKSLSSK